MILRAENVSRQFFRQGKGTNIFTALEETSLTLESGTLTEITGRSGSGKSTLLNICGGLLMPTSGHVFWDDTDLYALGDEERSALRGRLVGIIPQGQTGLRALNVKENILLPCAMAGEKNMEEKAEELMERVGISDLQTAYPSELSGGEMRRLAIARALIRDPQLILADEPTGDLDDENTVIVLSLLRDCADRGMTVMLVTHEKEAAAYADRICHMDRGLLKTE